MRERVSVIIPVYNGERFLAEAIQSVLDQTLPPDELIVVDDGSTDGTAAVVTGMASMSPIPIRYIYQANQGPAAARNQGIRVADGDFLAFLDADDLWAPEKQQTQMALITTETGADIVSGLTQQYLDAVDFQCSTSQLTVHQPYPDPHFQNKLICAALFDRVGYLDQNLRLGEDIDWLVQATQSGARIIQHNDIVVRYRRHAHNLTNQLGPTAQYWLMALRKATRRYREGVTSIG